MTRVPSIAATMVAALLVTAFTATTVLPQESPAVVAFENVTVIPLDRDRTLEGQTVVVEGRRITAMGSSGSVSVPEGALRIDGSGKFLIPGLAEMHGHIPSPQAGDSVIDRVMLLFVANGITTVRGMLGNPYHLELKAQVAHGERLGPQIFTSGPSLNGRSVPDVETAWRVVTEQRAAGYDLMKIHPGIQRDVYDQIAATAQAEGIPFAGHVPVDVGLAHALEQGQVTIEHVDGYIEAIVADDAPVDPASSEFFGFNLIDHVDESKIPGAVSATVRAGAWVTPTQALFNDILLGDPERAAQRPEMRYVSEGTLSRWVESVNNSRQNLAYSEERAERYMEVRRMIIKQLQDAGAGILLGADAPQIFNVPGFATLGELSLLVDAGLTPYQALRAGTTNPAIYLGEADSFGTIEVGKRADFILLEANPLDDITNVHRRSGVMLAGRWLDAADLQRRLDEISAGTN